MHFPDTGPIPYPRPASNGGVALAYAANDNSASAAAAGLSGPQADLIANVPVPRERAEVANNDNGLSVEDIIDSAGDVAESVGNAIVPAAEAAQPDTSIKTGSVRQPSGWVVQVGTAATPEGARAILARTQGKAGGALDKSEPFALAYNNGGQEIYRARFGGFSDQEEAVRACRSLKRNGVSCWASLQ